MTDYYMAFTYPNLMHILDPNITFTQYQKDFCYASWLHMWGPEKTCGDYWYANQDRGIIFVREMMVIYQVASLRDAEASRDVITKMIAKIHETR